MPWKNNDKDRCLPSLRAAWHGMHRLGAALVSGGARSVLLGQGLRAPWLGSPPQGLAPHPLVTTLSSEAHHPPAGLTCGCLAHPLCAPISSIWSQLHFLWDICKLKPELHPPPQGGKHSQIFLQQETPESFFSPPAASFHCCLCSISPALSFALQPSSRDPTPHIPSGERKGALMAAELYNEQGRWSQSQHLQGKPPPRCPWCL